MEKTELLACPFCGSKYIGVIIPIETDYQVQCGNCYASASIESTEKKAIKAWNRRAEPANDPPHYPGLYCKYNVFKVSDGSVVNDCFVLRPDRDPAAVFALRAYAAATANKSLADDIIGWVGKPDNPPLTMEELRKLKEATSYREFMPMEVNEDGERFCPRCHQEIVGYYTEYCEHCGQAVESPPEKGAL